MNGRLPGRGRCAGDGQADLHTRSAQPEQVFLLTQFIAPFCYQARMCECFLNGCVNGR